MVIPALPPEYEQFIRAEVASGRFNSPEEVVCVALHEMQRRRQLAQLQREVDAGLEQLDHGEGIRIESEAQLDEFFADVEARGQQRLKDRNRS